jgi:hypothetical protein
MQLGLQKNNAIKSIPAVAGPQGTIRMKKKILNLKTVGKKTPQ